MSPTGVPNNKTIQQIITVLDNKLPELANVMIHERNTYMTRALIHIQEEHPEKTILAVVGAGHIPGMNEALKNKKAKVRVYE
jgi:pheromone shutdown protein TraB